MRKRFNSLKKRTFLKYLLAILIFLILGIAYYLLKFSKNEVQFQKKYNKREIRTILAKADALYENYIYDSSYYYYNKAQLICDTNNDYIDYVYALTCMASIEQIQGDFVASEVSLTKTLQYLKKIKKPRFSANIYEQYAANYYYTYDYNNSLLYQSKALHLKTSYTRKIMVLNSICLNYIMQKKYKFAEDILISLSRIKSIHKKDKISNDNEYARILDNLGLCYLEERKPEALYCFNKSLTIKLALNDYTGLIYIYKHLSEYFQKSKPSLSKTYAKQAYTISCKLNNTPNKIQSLGLLIKSSEGNDLKRCSLKFITLVDSVTRTKQKAKNQFSTIKYDSKQIKQENLQLKAQEIENQLQLEKEKNRNILSSIIILFVTMISLLLYFHLKSKGRKEKNKAIFESEMRISKKLNDELTNDVFQTLNFTENIDLEKDENKEKLLNNLDTLYSRTRNISKENSTIVTDQHYNLALKEMISSFQSSGINILLNGLENISFHKIEKNTKITIYRVLQELLANTKKHSNASLVGINFKTLDKNIIINYTDNGKSISLNSMASNSGQQNIENRISAIKGKVQIESSAIGLKVFIKFPL